MSMFTNHFRGMRSSEMLKQLVLDTARDQLERKRRKEASSSTQGD